MWRSAKAERDEEFTAFMRDATPSLGRTAWMLTGNRAAAADLVQEALARTYAAWPRVRRTDALAYTRRILINTNISTWRKTRNETVTPPPESIAGSPEDPIANRDEAVRLLAELPPQQRAVLALRYFEDLSEADIAHQLGIPAGTVKSAASRGLQTLRTRLSEPEGSLK